MFYRNVFENYSATQLERGGRSINQSRGWRPIARVKVKGVMGEGQRLSQTLGWSFWWKQKACYYCAHLIFSAAPGGASGRSYVLHSRRAGSIHAQEHGHGCLFQPLAQCSYHAVLSATFLLPSRPPSCLTGSCFEQTSTLHELRPR